MTTTTWKRKRTQACREHKTRRPTYEDRLDRDNKWRARSSNSINKPSIQSYFLFPQKRPRAFFSCSRFHLGCW
jgi:hypothetical protein